MVKSSSRIAAMQQTLRLSPAKLQPEIAQFSFVENTQPDNHFRRDCASHAVAMIDDAVTTTLSYALSSMQKGHVFVAQPVNTGVEHWIHQHVKEQVTALPHTVAAYMFNVERPDCPQFVTFSAASWGVIEKRVSTLVELFHATLHQAKATSDIVGHFIQAIHQEMAQCSEVSASFTAPKDDFLCKNLSWLHQHAKIRYAALWDMERASAQWDAMVSAICRDIDFILRPQALNLGQSVVSAEFVDDTALFGRTIVKFDAHIQQHHYEIIPGLIHQALFGCLLLPLRYCDDDHTLIEKLLIALHSQSISIGTNTHQVNDKHAVFIRPEHAHAPCKIVFLGHPQTYYSMQEYFVLFDELVPVFVDVSSTQKLDARVASQFSQWIQGALLDYSKSGDFIWTMDEDALQVLAKTAMLDCENDGHISCDISFLRTILDEAIFVATQTAVPRISSSIIKKVLANRAMRHSLVNQSVLEDIDNQQILIETNGSLVGSVNGLTVFEAGQVSFGTPARITATVYPGTQGVVDIEREVELGQSIHSKGVLLLTGLLGSRYAQDFVLSLSANIALEQSYADIDGDSASLAEFIALLSAICQQPVTQSLALTGSINQCGDVQSVGGINQKIEGYFAVCQRRGHITQDGGKNYGVIIPQVNVGHLNLRDEIVEAVASGSFSIYAVTHIDEVITLMFNKPAGELKSNKQYPKQSINDLTQQGLIRLANIVNGEE